MNKLTGLALTTIFLLSACGEKEEEIHSKSFYIENDSARIEKVKYCNDYPSDRSPNCINAISAKGDIKRKKLMTTGIAIDYSKAETMHLGKAELLKYYSDNGAKRAERLKKCSGKEHSDRDCIAALEAENSSK